MAGATHGEPRLPFSQEQMMPKHEDEMEKAMAAEAQKAQGLAPIDPNVIALARELAKEIVAGQRAAQADLVEAQAEAYSGAMKTAMRPENADPPLISDFNPRGERDFPRPPFKCEFYDCNGNARIVHELSTVEEVELLNQLEPGQYLVEKTNGEAVPVSVVAEYDSASQALTKMKIYRRTKGDAKNDWPSLAKMLAQMIGVEVPVLPEREALKPKFGKITGPATLNTPGGVTGTIQTLESYMQGPAAGPIISRDIEQMQRAKADAIAPALG